MKNVFSSADISSHPSEEMPTVVAFLDQPTMQKGTKMAAMKIGCRVWPKTSNMPNAGHGSHEE